MVLSTSACEYHQHESGIYEFIFHEASRIAINEYFNLIDRIVLEAPADTVLLLLIDISHSGIPPMAYFIEKMRFSIRKYPHRLASRTAIIYKDSAILSIMHHIIKKLAGQEDTIRLFEYPQRDTVYTWLLDTQELQG